MHNDLINRTVGKMKRGGLTIKHLSTETKIPAHRIYKWLKGKGNPKTADADVLAKWLKSDEVEVVPREVTDYRQQRLNQKNKYMPFMVPLVPVKAQAGYVRAIEQEIFVDTLEQYSLPPGVNPHGAVWRYWEIEGESMQPVFNSGDYILTSLVPQMDWENLRNFYLYVVVTVDKILFKRLYCKNEREWVLISENEEHSPQQLLLVEDVKEVWVYRRSIVNKAPPGKVFEIKI
jgi:phage repressor protein C with HTH and peptisase S24 domain